MSENTISPQDFENSVKRVVALRSQLKILRQECAAARDELNNHRDLVLEYMHQTGLETITYKKHVFKKRNSQRKSKPSLKTIRENPNLGFFSTPEDCNRFFDKLLQNTIVEPTSILSIKDPREEKNAQELN